jgi:hypothetical protein
VGAGACTPSGTGAEEALMGSSGSVPAVCPYCGQRLVNRTAIEHLRRVQARLEETRKRLERQLRSELKAEAERRLAEEVERKVQALRAQEARRSQKMATTIEALREQVAELREERAARIREHRSELVAVRRELERRMREELAQERKRLKSVLGSSIARTERAKAERAYEGQLRALNRLVGSLRGENERLQRQLEQLSAADRGDWNEEVILRELQLAFREDEIRRQRRGRAGSDILHAVHHRSGGEQQEAGLIIYECKDTLRWSKDFIAQAKKAAKSHGTPYVILVSRAFPQRRKEMFVEDGVIVVHPTHVIHMARVVRSMVIGIHQAKLSAEGRARKTEELLRYLSGTAFRQALGTLTEKTRELRELLEEEQRTHKRVWARREQAYGEVRDVTDTIDTTIRGIIERPVRERRAKVVPIAAGRG